MFVRRARQVVVASRRYSAKPFSSFMLVDPNASSSEASLELTPEQVVYQLDQHIIGQTDAKKAVAIALRNRWRRRQIDGPMRSEISPMNILMSGPTGSGKTEIARRLARLTQSPFVKVEATKFTEVGVYGTNADSMIKDLTDIAIDMEREAAKKANASAAHVRAVERILDLLAPPHSSSEALRRKLRADIESGEANGRLVTVVLKPIESSKRRRHPSEDMMMELPPELQQMMKQLSGVLGTQGPNKPKGQTMTVEEALPKLEAEEAVSGLNEDDIVQRAIENVQTNGIVFLDEVDKLAQNNDNRSFRKGEGVQKELLALTEGCAVHTRHGIVHTDHILFIASGAFHNCSPSDLMPELQGRLPIRVNLAPLTEKDFVRILTETQYNLLDQVRALMATEDVSVHFTDDAINEIASVSAQVNVQTDNIGARRLATVVAKITEHVSFHAPALKGTTVTIDQAYVQKHLKDILQKTDLTKYIL
ncbi:ATP-dependent hsl protease ATP-binding subunit hslU [Achlya hypogyna]|uniref:ATP-dependent hsl protease ATP-binding subunit hslU n=1 Tax=Achlya hypogyna TaxID=1202772 RepID=A0A1V9ZR85_ACHHY|nr:ATP-dependent hsl protease ATP-binding subunit hslU [Achlya hypogyna]